MILKRPWRYVDPRNRRDTGCAVPRQPGPLTGVDAQGYDLTKVKPEQLHGRRGHNGFVGPAGIDMALDDRHPVLAEVKAGTDQDDYLVRQVGRVYPPCQDSVQPKRAEVKPPDALHPPNLRQARDPPQVPGAKGAGRAEESNA
jgi:hypothetical protein